MRLTARLVAAAGSMVLVAGMVVVATPASAAPTLAPTRTYKACADKDSGAIRLIVQGKKCKKSERRLSWNVQGPQGMAGPVGPQGPQGNTGATGATGAQGVPGPALTVRDGNGTLLGQLQVLTPGPTGEWYVLFEGGSYNYLAYQSAPGADRRQNSGTSVYLDNTCSGTPYQATPGAWRDFGAGGPERVLQTFTDGSAEAFAFRGATSTTFAVATPAWQKNPAKACVAAAPLAAGTKAMPMTRVTAPPFAVGQIHIG